MAAKIKIEDDLSICSEERFHFFLLVPEKAAKRTRQRGSILFGFSSPFLFAGWKKFFFLAMSLPRRFRH
jgi:hypothetical protein